MSDKNVFTLVGNKEQSERAKIKALHQPHLDEMFKQFSDGSHSYMVISIDNDGNTSFLTDLDHIYANFQLDKVKINILLPPMDDD